MIEAHASVNDVIKAARKHLASQREKNHQHITFDENHKVTIHGKDKDLVYVPSQTGLQFHGDLSFVRLITGPYGSGKSTTAILEIIKQSANMPFWDSGQRRSRWAIVRNTSGELISTSLKTWLTWFGDLGVYTKRQKPLMTYDYQFNDGNGLINLELIFIALDRPDDVRKIKSLELTGVYLNELSELPQNVLSHFKGRVNRRYPSLSFCPEPYWSGIIADTNPPDEDHWIFKDFEVNQSENYRIFHQPSGLLEDEKGELIKDNYGRYIQNPDADNVKHIDPTYYPILAEKQSQGFIKVYCCGKYGIVEAGKRVYPEFNYDIHSAQTIDAIQGDPLYLGWDFGLTPACVVVQITARGQVRVLKEYVAEDIGIKTFAKNIVIPRLAIDFPYCKVGGSEGDPSGAKGDEIMEELSCIGELNSLGIPTNPASTNDPDVRINSVRYFLNLMVDGKPGFIISREGCPITVKGFMSGYVYKRLRINNDERYHDKPDKNRYSHSQDALQYRLMPFASERPLTVKPKEVDMFNPVFRWQN